MFGKKLNQGDLEELRKRAELINQHILISNALEVQKQVYIRGILPKYGLDLNRNYEIDLKTGQIKLVKEEPKK